MKGTEKQIEFAAKCIESAAARFADVDHSGRQTAALRVIALVEAGDLASAEDALQEAAQWVTTCIVEHDGRPVIDAGSVIDALRAYA